MVVLVLTCFVIHFFAEYLTRFDHFQHLRDILRDFSIYKLSVAVVGHKRDSWFAIDYATGTKVQTLSVDSAPGVCPSSGINQLFIGRTGMSVTRSLYAALWLYCYYLKLNVSIGDNKHFSFLGLVLI